MAPSPQLAEECFPIRCFAFRHGIDPDGQFHGTGPNVIVAIRFCRHLNPTLSASMRNLRPPHFAACRETKQKPVRNLQGTADTERQSAEWMLDFFCYCTSSPANQDIFCSERPSRRCQRKIRVPIRQKGPPPEAVFLRQKGPSSIHDWTMAVSCAPPAGSFSLPGETAGRLWQDPGK